MRLKWVCHFLVEGLHLNFAKFKNTAFWLKSPNLMPYGKFTHSWYCCTCCLYLLLSEHVTIQQKLMKELLAVIHPEVGIGVVGVTVLTGLPNGHRDPGKNLFTDV